MDVSQYLPMFLAEGREHLQELNLSVVRIEEHPDRDAPRSARRRGSAPAGARALRQGTSGGTGRRPCSALAVDEVERRREPERARFGHALGRAHDEVAAGLEGLDEP